MSANEPKQQPQEPTLDDLKALVKDYEKQIKELEKQLDEHSPESIYSVNIPPVTIRARPGETLERFAFRVSKAIQQFTASGVIKTVQPQPNTQTASDDPFTESPQTTSTPQTQTSGANGNDLKFRVDMLEGFVSNGRASWKAKGKPFTQYGITVYPEVLAAAGLGIADGQNYAANGQWVAHYVLGQTGKPFKVVKLEKA